MNHPTESQVSYRLIEGSLEDGIYLFECQACSASWKLKYSSGKWSVVDDA